MLFTVVMVEEARDLTTVEKRKRLKSDEKKLGGRVEFLSNFAL